MPKFRDKQHAMQVYKANTGLSALGALDYLAKHGEDGLALLKELQVRQGVRQRESKSKKRREKAA